MWAVWVEGENTELDRVVKRRGGPGFDYPCASKTMVQCALWECQSQGRCRLGGILDLPERRNGH
jgi:hypothetical protein